MYKNVSDSISEEKQTCIQTHHLDFFLQNPLLPVTVTDQIRLWEREKNRLQADEGEFYINGSTRDNALTRVMTTGILHSNFHTGADFELVKEYAESMGVLLWQDTARRLMFVSSAGMAPVRDFIARRRLHD
jgi:transcription initiation factor TFIIH subunit 4